MGRLALLAALLLALLAPRALRAQDPAFVSGRVTDTAGAPQGLVQLRINALNVGAVSAPDGTYRMLIPASRVRPGMQVTLTAYRLGLATASRPIVLNPGAQLTVDFRLGNDALRLAEVVAMAVGTSTLRVRATTAVTAISAQQMEDSHETNVVAAMAGKAPNVLITSSSGDPGAGAFIQVRGAASVYGGTQPLFVLDGTPIDNSTIRTEDPTTGTAITNRAADLNPNDVADVQILKGGAATALYGSRGANGVVLMTTRSGRPGQTRATFNTTLSADRVTKLVPLQRAYGQGLNEIGSDDRLESESVQSWGVRLPRRTPTYDHAAEMYRPGRRWESNLALSGGSDATTWYLSLGRLDQRGVIVGPQAYDRTTARLKATHSFGQDLTVGGNFAFTNGFGDFVQQGSNISGIQLGALRTPPEFDNKPYLDPVTGYHRSYRCAVPECTGSLENGRGFDNPFWVAYRMPNTTSIDRTFGNVNLEYAPSPSVRLSYILGADLGDDERRQLWPKSSSDAPEGKLIRASLRNFQLESRFLATLQRNFSGRATGTLSLGQTLTHDAFDRYQTNGYDLVYGADQLDFAVTKVPDEYHEVTRSDGYFANGELTLWDQLTLTGNVLNEGASTFGAGRRRFWYPGAGFAWQASKLSVFDPLTWVDLVKVRANLGVSGRQPPAYVTQTVFAPVTYVDDWVTNAGWTTIYLGRDGVVSQDTAGNPDIRPERKVEWEAGFDLGVLGGRAALGFTYYSRVTRDMIVAVTLPPSSGSRSQFRNAGRVDNHGVELTLNLKPVDRRTVSWAVDAQYARNRSCVKQLTGTESVDLAGFSGSMVSLVSPAVDGRCHPFGVFWGTDWVRFGRGEKDTRTGQAIDAAYPGAPAGAVYLDPSGFPQLSQRAHVVGDPNPRWTGSVRNTVTLGPDLRLSALVDVSHGGQMWNGTRGALVTYGTHRGTQAWHGAGMQAAFGHGFLDQFTYAGPGEGKTVTIDRTWGTGLGGGFGGPMSEFVEDAGFVKLRDVSLTWTVDRPWLRHAVGVSRMDLTVGGRNLKTWTRYSGIDPETNLTGQTVGRGIDYFNNPQTRSLVIAVSLER
jgi:TonB-linked SusC/RagA family outer membrane protein